MIVGLQFKYGLLETFSVVTLFLPCFDICKLINNS